MPIADDGWDDALGRPAWAHPRLRLNRRRLLLLGTAGAGAAALMHGVAATAAGARAVISHGRPARGAGSSAICATCGQAGHSMLRCNQRPLK